MGGTAATGELRGGVGSLVAPSEGGRLFTSSSGSVCSGGSGLYSLVISARPSAAHNFELYDTHLFFYLKLTFNLKAFGRLQQPTELCVLDPHLTLVHELDDGAQITKAHVFEDDDWMPGRVVNEQRPEVRRAGGQHNLQIPESSRCSIPETSRGKF